jgi:AcrR family transcriptional regulator
MAQRSPTSLRNQPGSLLNRQDSLLHRPDRAPTGFSRDDIIEKTMELLISHWADDLSFSQIAEALGTTSGTLHYFYASRADLLNEVASHAFAGLKLPKRRIKRPWQEELRAWLWAIQKYCQQNPVALRSMAFEGRVSDAWIDATAPVVRIFRALGLEGKTLAFAVTWFLGDAMGQIMSEYSSPAFRRPGGLIRLEDLGADNQDNLRGLREHLPQIDGAELLEFGFEQLIKSIEELVRRQAR